MHPLARIVCLSFLVGAVGSAAWLFSLAWFWVEPIESFFLPLFLGALGVGLMTGLIALWVAVPLVQSNAALQKQLQPKGDKASRSPASSAALQKQSKEIQRANERLKGINRSLERLKESYRDLYHNAPVMYFSLDAAGRLVSFNDTLARALDYSRGELQGEDFSRLLAPEAAALWSRQQLGADSSNHPLAREHEYETCWQRRDGSLLDVLIRSDPIRDAQGSFLRSRSAAVDLTERKQLANELRARGDELERTNERLRRINTELEDFTHVISHDLKEPLRTLQAFSHILAEEFSTQLGPDGFQYVNHLIQASRRLGLLIDDLLTLGQAGRIAHKTQTFDLNEVVATVRRDLADLIQRKEAAVLTEGSLPTLMGDQARITQLVANLVANGLKYNQHATPQVVIGAAPNSAAAFPLGPQQTVFFVRDNGIGIEPGFHEHIFGSFRRLHRGEQYEGTGAGLAICKKIVEAHRGRIWVESQTGQGATFYFTLPTRTTSLVMKKKEDPEPNNTTPSKTHGQPRTTPPQIVLVEDMVDIGAIIKKLASKSGVLVRWYTNGEEAWEYLAENVPDLLLLDIHLPGMSGVELCQKVREVQPDLTIILFSQETDPDKIDFFRRAGANHIWSKDLLGQPPLWQKKINSILNERKTQDG